MNIEKETYSRRCELIDSACSGSELEHAKLLSWQRCPARLEFAGHHMDYVGGSSIAGAINIYNEAIVLSNNDKYIIRAMDADGSIKSLDIDINDSKALAVAKSDPVFKYVFKTFNQYKKISGNDINQGFKILINCEIPYGMGLGGSASMITAIFMAFCNLFGNLPDNIAKKIPIIVQTIEQNCGAKCGILDPYAEFWGDRDMLMEVNPINAIHPPLKRYAGPKVESRELWLISTDEKHDNTKELSDLVSFWWKLQDDTTDLGDFYNKLCKDNLNKSEDEYKPEAFKRIAVERKVVAMWNEYLMFKVEYFNKKYGNAICPTLYTNTVKYADKYLGNITEKQHKIIKCLSEVKGVEGLKPHGAGFGGVLLMVMEPDTPLTGEKLTFMKDILYKVHGINDVNFRKVKLVDGAHKINRL